MAKQQILDWHTDDFIAACINRGILPAGTTRVSVWAGNKPDGLGGVISHTMIIIANDAFDDVTPIPTSTVDIPTEIQNLGV